MSMGGTDGGTVVGTGMERTGALGGGGTISLKTDAQGKTLSTALLRMEIDL